MVTLKIKSINGTASLGPWVIKNNELIVKSVTLETYESLKKDLDNFQSKNLIEYEGVFDTIVRINSIKVTGNNTLLLNTDTLKALTYASTSFENILIDAIVPGEQGNNVTVSIKIDDDRKDTVDTKITSVTVNNEPILKTEYTVFVATGTKGSSIINLLKKCTDFKDLKITLIDTIADYTFVRDESHCLQGGSGNTPIVSLGGLPCVIEDYDVTSNTITISYPEEDLQGFNVVMLELTIGSSTDRIGLTIAS